MNEKQFHTEKLTTWTGEVLELRCSEDGEWVCPVCGDILGTGGAPYNSYSICVCCGVEYGHEDSPRQGQFQAQRWAELREKWMESEGHAGWTLRQLKNLGDRIPTPDEVPQGVSLYTAAPVGHVPSVERLLAEGTDPNEKGEHRETPLLESRSLEISRLLLEAGADVNAQGDGGYFPLSGEVAGDDVEGLRLLLQWGARVDLRNGEGLTPLLYACMHSRKKVLPVLIEAGANLEASGGTLQATPLIHACRVGDPEVIETLVRAGANVNARDYAEATPLMWFAGRDYVVEEHQHFGFPGKNMEVYPFPGTGKLIREDTGGVVRLLVEAGADVNARTRRRWLTALMCSALRPPHEELDGVEMSIYNKLYLSRTDPEVTKVLLECGADATLKNNDGKTALDLAIESGATEVAEILRQHGA